MIPIRDDQPTFSTPFVNYFLIIANVAIYLWQASLEFQSPRAADALIHEFGVEPRAFSGVADLHREQKVVHYGQDLLLPVVVHK